MHINSKMTGKYITINQTSGLCINLILFKLNQLTQVIGIDLQELVESSGSK